MGPRRRIFQAALTPFPLLASITLFTGCRQILDITERNEAPVEGADAGDAGDADKAPSVPTVGACGAFTSFSKPCAECLDTACCDVATACHDDSTCDPTFQCLSSCSPNDAACGLRCLASFARGDALADVMACRAAQCNDACDLQAGGLPYGFDSCNDCVVTSCADPTSTCVQNADCIKAEFCDENCLPAGSIECSNTCHALYPNGTDALASRDSCAADTCAMACSADKAWTCLDAPLPWLKPTKLDPIVVTMEVVNFLDQTPYPGVTVKACTRADSACPSGLASTVTDAHGSFTMTIPLGNAGFDGYLDIKGPGVYPALYYFVPPLLVGGQRGQLRLPSTTTMPMLIGALGATPDDQRGHLAVVPLNCGYSQSAGVSLTIDTTDKGYTPYYFVQGLPNKTAVQTSADPAIGGFVNLPPEPTLVHALVPGHNNQQSAALLFNIRAGTLTTGTMSPTPP